MRKLQLLIGVLLALGITAPLRGQTVDPAFVGHWTSGISQNGGVQWLVVEFRADGKFTRQFWHQDGEGFTPTEGAIRGAWASGKSTIGDDVLCSRNTARAVTACISYTWLDPDHFVFGEITFHRMSQAELKVIATPIDPSLTPS